MKVMLALVLALMLATFSAHAEEKKVKTFDDWIVEIDIDEFDKKVKATLKADIRSRDGEHMGVLSTTPSFLLESVLFFEGVYGSSFWDLNPHFPYCDFEFVRYRIDAGDTHHLPTWRHACEHPIIDAAMISKFRAGITFEFVVKKHIGVVSLKGFTAAWNYARSRVKG